MKYLPVNKCITECITEDTKDPQDGQIRKKSLGTYILYHLLDPFVDPIV